MLHHLCRDVRYSIALGFLLAFWFMGCSSQQPVQHATIVALQGQYVSGAWNVGDLKQGKQLTRQLLASLPQAAWPSVTTPQAQPSPDQLLPDFVGAWKLGEDPRLYRGKEVAAFTTNSQRLYDYSFVEVVSAAYYEKYLGKDPLLQVDLYNMGSATNAFGIYSLRRNLQSSFQKIGAEAVVGDESLHAWKGTYYLKIQTWSIADAISEGMVRIAQEIFRRIEGEATLPALLRILPVEAKHPGTGRLFRTYASLDASTQVPAVNVLQLDQTTLGVLGEYRKKESKLELDTLVLFGIRYTDPGKALTAFEFYRATMQQQAPTQDAGIGTMSFVSN